MYTKLFGSIVHSTIWREPDYVRLVWITMLAMSDKKGCVWAAIPGLADAARVSLEDCEKAIERLSSPDHYSRTQESEGRRIEAIDGGWFLINHSKFQAIKNIDERRESVRLAVKRHRAKKAQEHDDVINPVIEVIPGNGQKARVSEVSPSDQTIPDKTKKPRASVEVSAEERGVLGHYIAVHPRRKDVDAAREAVRGAIKRGYTPDDCRLAIDGNAATKWCREGGKHDLTFTLRKDQIDNFIAAASRPVVAPSAPKVEHWTDRKARDEKEAGDRALAAQRGGNVERRRAQPDGQNWWQRMLSEAKAAGVHPILYAFDRIHEPAEVSLATT